MSRPTNQSKIALVLAGGGLSGVVYEIGALCAIDDLLVDRSVNDFDVYVGTSAGAIVAAGLVVGLTPQNMFHAVDGKDPSLPLLKQNDLFHINFRTTLQHIASFPRSLWRSFQHYYQHPIDLNLYDLLWELAHSMPSSLYDSRALEGYLQRLFGKAGLVNDFRQLSKQLYIVATHLRSGERVVFGDEAHLEVPISLAIAASSAVPAIYKPVRIGEDEYIDGGVRGNASLDLAVENGAELIICINPMVPYQHNTKHYIGDEGLQAVLDQTFRIALHSGVHYHLKQMRRQYPHVDVILIEPRREDEQLLFSNVMRYSTRLTIAEQGYHSVQRNIVAQYESLKKIFERHGLTISLSQLEQMRQLGDSAKMLRSILDGANADHRKW